MRKSPHWANASGACSTIAATFTASLSACAGGVCAVGAQTASAWAAASATTAGSLSVLSASPDYPWWHPSNPVAAATSDFIPLWTKGALLVLWVSVIYTVILLAKRPAMAWIAALGGMVVSVAELHWLPGGHPALSACIALGIVALISAPWLDRWHPKRCLARLNRWLLILLPTASLLVVLVLQLAQHWSPCPLCWVQRAALFLIVVAVLARTFLLPVLFSLLGFSASLGQIIEMDQSSRTGHFLARVCSTMASSCASAGGKVFVFPIVWDSTALFVMLFLLALFHAANFWNGHAITASTRILHPGEI